MSFTGCAPHIVRMTTFVNPHVLAHPVRHRITLIETAEDVDYFAESCNGHPDSYGNYTAAFADPVPVLGSYLVEELTDAGEPSGLFELMAFEKFNRKFKEVGDPTLEYGARLGDRGLVHPSRTVSGARFLADAMQHPIHTQVKAAVVSRPSFSDDEWTVVGR